MPDLELPSRSFAERRSSSRGTSYGALSARSVVLTAKTKVLATTAFFIGGCASAPLPGRESPSSPLAVGVHHIGAAVIRCAVHGDDRVQLEMAFSMDDANGRIAPRRVRVRSFLIDPGPLARHGLQEGQSVIEPDRPTIVMTLTHSSSSGEFPEILQLALVRLDILDEASVTMNPWINWREHSSQALTAPPRLKGCSRRRTGSP